MDSQKQLIKELTSLSATLKLETSRRQAATNRIKDLEVRLGDAISFANEQKYINKHLAKELENLKQHELVDINMLRKRLSKLDSQLSSKLHAATDQYKAAASATVTLKAAITASKTTNHPAADGLHRIEQAAGQVQQAIDALGDVLTACDVTTAVEGGIHAHLPSLLVHNNNNNSTRSSSSRGNADDDDAEVEKLRAHIHQLNLELSAAKASNNNKNTDMAPGIPSTNSNNSASSTTSQNVDSAVQELQAIVPQYKAAASALQGRVTVLTAQLNAAVTERDEYKKKASLWKEAAQHHESSYATAAAKLHSSEVQSLSHVTDLQERCERLATELQATERRCAAAESAAGEASRRAEKTEALLLERERVCAAQEDTIAQLESTVNEQQHDIVAALDLACGAGVRKSVNDSKKGVVVEKKMEKNSRLGVASDGTAAAGGAEWSIAAAGSSSVAPYDECSSSPHLYQQHQERNVTFLNEDFGREIKSLKHALKHALAELKN